MTGLQTIADGMRRWRFWTFLAWQDIKQRYRGSVIGPFWTVGHLALTIAGIGFLYSGLMNISQDGYFPFLAAGLLFWFLISSTVVDATNAFPQAGSILRQSSVPPIIFPLRIVVRNLIVFGHNMFVFVVVAVIFGTTPDPLPLLFTFPLLLVNLAWLSILVALMSARYRDLGQLISQLMGFFLFVTPIFWVPSAVSGFRSAYVLYNPFAHFLEIVRAPLMGEAPAGISIVVCSALAVIGWAVAIFALIRHQRKVVFWI
ncbi:ABC transporter permease [Marinicauda sp. Alg238-R41]|uniref:ABC transporter permease n=1 Tax=Marinicauda sp. Alg238-R41 TaxID=2993447 RepID=UPI0022E65858|nr:ABC transporter permease [Marinicauda sp. Alg238-R41]